MGKSVGATAGVLALCAVLVHTFGNDAGKRAPTSAAQQEIMPGLSSSAPPASSQAHIASRQGPWRATQQYFHSEPGVIGDAFASCLAQPLNPCPRNKLLALYGFPADFDQNELRSLIATVPDPLHTRMAMQTDRFLDTIQQAAFRSGYELAAQWLPWTVKAAAEKIESGDSASRNFDLEKLPGLIVFRPHFTPYSNDLERLLLIFVVGETPTAGLNGFQFEVARQAILGLGSREPDRISVAGPNFSGSFLSLTRLLEEVPGRYHFELRSGSASNADYARAMLVELASKGFAIDQETGKQPSVTFHSSALPSRTFRNHFIRLVNQLGLRREQAAELVEDETGFSYTARRLNSFLAYGPPITYRYPRDIAQLRNIYNDAAFTESPQFDSKGTPPVDFSLKDTQSGEDAFPTFSTSHTPLSQDSELAQIAHYLRRSSIRLVSLSATNVFDTLFLASVLARDCPDTRIVLQGADLLFIQEAARGSLAGVMAISPFPLFPEGAQMSQTSLHAPPDVTTFASSDQVGEFNAILSLLRDSGNSSYRQPFETSADGLPSAWLLVLSPKGWMPVDLFGQVTPTTLEVNHEHVPWFDPQEASPAPNNLLAGMPRAGFGWAGLCFLQALLSIVLCGRLFYLKANPKRHVWSVLCLSDLETSERRHAMSATLHARYICMLSCFATLATLNGFLLCPMLTVWLRDAKPAGLQAGAVAIVAVAIAACLATFVYVAVTVPVRICDAGPLGVCPINTPISWWSVALRAAILGIAIAILCGWWACCDNGPAGYMLCFRTLTLSAPVCPIWPLLLAGWGLFSLSFFHLRRFTWGDRRQPHLDTSVFDEALCNEFGTIKERLEHALLSTFGAGGQTALFAALLAAAGFALTLWMLLPAGSLSSFEPLAFSRILEFLLLLLAFYSLVTFVRLGRCWTLLRAFLVSLNSVVLGRFFMRIPEFGGSGPVWIREVKLMSLATAVNSGIALHNLEIKQGTPGAYSKSYISALQNFLSPNNGDGSRLDFICAYENFRVTASRIATTLGADVLRSYWKKNELPFVGIAACESDEDTAEPKPRSPAEEVFATAVASKHSELTSAGAAVGRMQSFFLESHTSQPQAVGHTSTKESQPISTEIYEQAAKYVALHYSAYIGYGLHQLQNLLLCCVVCFVLLVAALNSFSFQAPQTIFHLLSAVLVMGGCAILLIFAQMERDPILSRLSGTAEGELGKDFYIRALTYGALPVLSVLTTEFPAISRYLSDWIQPASTVLR